MRDEGRDVDEVARAGLGHELELVAPAHAGLAANDVDYALDRAVVMRAGLGLGVDDDGAGPEFLGAGARVGDGGGAVHARGLRGVDVELVGVDDAHAVVLPLGLGIAHREPPGLRASRSGGPTPSRPASPSTTSSAVCGPSQASGGLLGFFGECIGRWVPPRLVVTAG